MLLCWLLRAFVSDCMCCVLTLHLCWTALQAAESAIQALEAGNTAAIAAAEATAAAAHARSSLAMEANSKGYKLARQYDEQEAKRSKQEEQPEVAKEGEAQAEAEAVAAANGDADADASAAAAAAADADDAAQPPAAAMAAAGEAGNGELAYQPSWARGGGGRGRTGGRFRGIDPIYPVEDPKILQVGPSGAASTTFRHWLVLLGVRWPARVPPAERVLGGQGSSDTLQLPACAIQPVPQCAADTVNHKIH
jgi:hypothetical protein